MIKYISLNELNSCMQNLQEEKSMKIVEEIKAAGFSEEEKRRFKAILDFEGEYIVIHEGGYCEILKEAPKKDPPDPNAKGKKLVIGGEINDFELVKKLEEMFGVERKIPIEELIGK